MATDPYNNNNDDDDEPTHPRSPSVARLRTGDPRFESGTRPASSPVLDPLVEDGFSEEATTAVDAPRLEDIGELDSEDAIAEIEDTQSTRDPLVSPADHEPNTGATVTLPPEVAARLRYVSMEETVTETGDIDVTSLRKPKPKV